MNKKIIHLKAIKLLELVELATLKIENEKENQALYRAVECPELVAKSEAKIKAHAEARFRIQKKYLVLISNLMN